MSTSISISQITELQRFGAKRPPFKPGQINQDNSGTTVWGNGNVVNSPNSTANVGPGVGSVHDHRPPYLPYGPSIFPF